MLKDEKSLIIKPRKFELPDLFEVNEMKKEILIPLMSIIIYTLIGVMFSYYILKDSIYFNSFIDKLDNDQIEKNDRSE